MMLKYLTDLLLFVIAGLSLFPWVFLFGQFLKEQGLQRMEMPKDKISGLKAETGDP